MFEDDSGARFFAFQSGFKGLNSSFNHFSFMRLALRFFDKQKLLFQVIICFFVVLCSSGYCRAEISNKATPSYQLTPAGRVNAICEEIVVGNFDHAERLIEQAKGSENVPVSQYRWILDQYKSLQTDRNKLRADTYQQRIDEFNEYRQKYQTLPQSIEDVNDIEGIFATVLKSLRYCDESQKKALLADPLVRSLEQITLKRAKELEAKGNWSNAYSKCYFWLKAIAPDNREYRNHTEELTERIHVKTMLKDKSDTKHVDRYGGIKPEIFHHAIKVLDFNYVSIIDYGQMAAKAMRRCKFIGEVLVKADDGFAYKTTPEAFGAWSTGLEKIRRGGGASFASLTQDRFLMIFNEIIALNSITLQLPQELIIDQFSQASLEALDPYTVLVWPKTVSHFQKNLTQEFTGIGIRFAKVDGVLRINSLIPYTPAYYSGLDAGDEITAVNGESTADMSSTYAITKISGPKGTEVILTVRRAGTEKTEDIKIVRNKIIVPSVQGWQQAERGKWHFVIDQNNKIAYLRITGFVKATPKEMENALKELEAQGLNGLIIDLRFNQGGILPSAVALVDMFVAEGLIIKRQPRYGFSTYERAHKKNTHADYPLVILINGDSASASEIVAGALQDPTHCRATIVGSRSYGKGTVQAIISAGWNAQLKYTTAYYHLPSDQRVKNRYIVEKQGRKDWGIPSDVEVKLLQNELRKMIKMQDANEIVVKADHDNQARPVKRYSLKDTLDADPQLAVGLLVLKAKMIQSGITLNIEEPVKSVATLPKTQRDTEQ